MNINIDTIKIKNSSENLETIADKYNEIIEKIFEELQNIETSGAWQGATINSSVYQYINIILEEKKVYYDLALNVKKISEALKEYAENNELIINQKI